MAEKFILQKIFVTIDDLLHVFFSIFQLQVQSILQLVLIIFVA